MTDTIKTKNTIEVVWHIDDVKRLDNSLTDEQCREVLAAALDEHDATIGINWDVLQYHISKLRESKHV